MEAVTRPLSICVTGAADSPHESERAQALRRLGHRVRMVSPTPATLDGIPVTVPWGAQLRPAPVRRLAVMLSTLWTLWRERADVVHCHYAAEYATWAAAVLGKSPLVITVMGGDVLFDEQGTQGAVGRALTRFALRRADLVTVKSPRLAQVVADMGVARDRIMEVLWGIDLQAFRADSLKVEALRNGWGAADDAVVFFSPRPFKPFYNQPLMVEALARVRAQFPNTLLAMTTYGEADGYREQLQAQAQALGCGDALRFVEPCAHADMAHLYGASDIVLSIPPSDGFPQTLVEAAAIGKPCIMTGAERFTGLIAAGEQAIFTDMTVDAVTARCFELATDAALRQRVAASALAFSRARADLMVEAARVSNRMQDLVGGTPCAA